MQSILIAALGAASLLLAVPALAQDPDEHVEVRSITECELHIWPTENINATKVEHSFVLAPGGSIGQTFWRELTLQQRMERVLTIEFQRKALEGSELITHPALKGRKLIWHDEPSPPRNWMDKDAMSVWKRLSASEADCYSELHYGYITFLDQPGKGVVQTGWLLRHFGDRNFPIRWGWEGGYEKSKRSIWTDEGTAEEARTIVTANIRENFRKFLTRRKIKRVLREMSGVDE